MKKLRLLVTLLNGCMLASGCTEHHDVLFAVASGSPASDGPTGDSAAMGGHTGAAVDNSMPDASLSFDAGPLGDTEPDALLAVGSPRRTLSASRTHSCVILDGALWCWGDNRRGAFDAAQQIIDIPVELPGQQTWISVSLGVDFGCALDAESKISCFGDNQFGQLGQGDFMPRTEPVQVALPMSVRQMEVHESHVCAVTIGGELWCWGNNTERQLGLGGFPPGDPEPSPVRVNEAQDWRWVGLGQGHTCGIRAPGALWCWGRNTSNELGLGGNEPGQHGTPQRVGEAVDWLTVSGGLHHTCALRQDASAWCWGGNDNLQLGMGDAMGRSTPTRVAAVDATALIEGNHFNTCALTVDGSFWCWGWNQLGALGTGNRVDSSLPVLIAPAGGFKTLAVGWQHNCGTRDTEVVLCAGKNDEGQLGNGTTQLADRYQPVIGLPLGPQP